MKLLYKISIACSAALMLAKESKAQESATIDSSYLNSRYEYRLDFFRKMPNQKNEIVFLGNSLTEAGKWHELVGTKRVVNRGISGDVTYGIIARLDEVLESKPAKIFLLSGVNDMKRGIPNEVIAQNFERIIKMVKSKSPKTKLYIESILPVNEGMLSDIYAKVNNVKIHDVNKRLETLCEKHKVTYVNLHPVLSDEKEQLKKELSSDGLHLRQDAYILWVNYLKEQKFL
ncbi:lipolytic protein G-D-S-L family [Pseudopedobacter saltans DSM 12145]|uniref:Lipolytic protein G-D-S-L family n=1 Tax=Pseudopedobacter saltans (strain ATCC 51119 / DSM 12145 / JCM 21818 / CCUG 39354 / LMG 10337 / NBRC 100064 / NCIMB 13643) TaxID=762903 RepID=F0SC27_PSESL|nr:GDSL-type esterase/lipase family protein [Pseudopedobacter saltans]ADY50612.1 lipolytic protein G-D-S-L family [Pseudopedobacter saltans DSM 12145]